MKNSQTLARQTLRGDHPERLEQARMVKGSQTAN